MGWFDPVSDSPHSFGQTEDQLGRTAGTVFGEGKKERRKEEKRRRRRIYEVEGRRNFGNRREEKKKKAQATLSAGS